MSDKVTTIYLSDGETAKKGDVVLKIENPGRIKQVKKARGFY
ncbi:hypothetical protein [Wolbachia endosymbiont of Litomosoides brasiliensis]|nr:hypothetical protein [Wolbachia endosymbiont of Litomosoides brasiliensis]